MPLSKKRDRRRKSNLVKLESAIKSNPNRLESEPMGLEEEALDPIHNPSKYLPPEAKQEKLAQLRELIADPTALRAKSSTVEEESNTIPRYNPRNPQIGEKVKMPSGEIVVVPELDGEGNRIW